MSNLLPTLMALYTLGLSISIAGMEAFGWMLFLYALFHFLITWKKTAQRPVLALGFDKYILGFWLVMTLGALFIPHLKPTDQIYIFGEGRWIVLLYSYVYLFRHHSFDLRKSSNWILGLYALVTVLSISEFFTGVVPFTGKEVMAHDVGSSVKQFRVSGYFGNSMTYAHNMGLWFSFFVSLFVMRKKLKFLNKKLLLLTVVLVSVGLLLTFTRGVWISVLVATFFMLFLVERKKALYFATAGVVALVGLLAFSPLVRNRVANMMDESNQGRVLLWRANWAMFKDYPLLGVGYRQNAKHTLKYYDKLGIDSDFASHAHNNYLQVLAGTGVFGLASYLAFNLILLYLAAQLYRKNKDSRPLAAAIGLGVFMAYVHLHVGGLSEANFQDGEVSHSYVFLTALMLAYRDKDVLIPSPKE